jgi:hypothetical protein
MCRQHNQRARKVFRKIAAAGGAVKDFPAKARSRTTISRETAHRRASADGRMRRRN